MAKDKEMKLGAGLDVGTMTLVAARKIENNIGINSIRNAFLDLPIEHKRMLKLSQTSYVEKGEKLLVLGDQALETANLFNREARRPMMSGMISAGELDAQEIILLMIEKLLGKPKKSGERCCFSVPAKAIDVAGSDVTYHRMILNKILQELDYSPEPINEAQAVIFSEAAKEKFSGIGISYGAGMTNVCLSYNAMSALEFSIAKGGDWIDTLASQAVGTTQAKITSLKESGIDLTKPTGREQEAIVIFLQSLIESSIDGIIDHFHSVKRELLVPKPIPIIVSGGTSRAIGFVDKFKEVFEAKKSKFPIEISEIRKAEDPMTAVATGLLIVAHMDE